MQINKHIFFAPGILLKDLDLNNRASLIDAFKFRVNGYYLRPIKILNKLKSAFPAAIIEFSMIDALARYSSKNNRVGDRIKEMLNNSFKTSSEIAEKAYEDFRNGLLHENHIKNCGQLCYETTSSFEMRDNCLIVNPLKLQRQLDDYFTNFIELLSQEDSVYETFINRMYVDFASEIEFFKKVE